MLFQPTIVQGRFNAKQMRMGMITQAAASPSDVLHIRRISGKDVKCFNFFQKPSFYAVAALSTSDEAEPPLQRQRTPADTAGGSNPEWKHTFQFDLSHIPAGPDSGQDFLVQFDLLAQIAVFGDRVVGRVFVPLVDLLSAGTNAGFFQSVMYQIRCPDGTPNGVLSFSYKTSGTFISPQPLPASTGSSSPQDQLPGVEYSCLPTEIYPPVQETFPEVESCLIPSGIYPKIDQAFPAVENYEQHLYPPSPAYSIGYYPPRQPICYPPPEPVLGYPAPAPAVAYDERYEQGFVPCESLSLYPRVW